MCTTKNYFKIILSLSLMLTLFTNSTFSQEYTLNNQSSELVVSGTSSLHDWHITAEKQKGVLTLSQSDQKIIQKMKFEIFSESLESGRKSMDKNTFKALKTEDFKYITFQLIEIKDISKMDNGDYNVKSVGNLIVAGTTQRINLDFKMSMSDNKVVLNGEKTIKMTDFNIEPPKALLGTITTGDEITITFKTILNK